MMLERREHKNPVRKHCLVINETERELYEDRKSKEVKSKLFDYQNIIHLLSDTIFAVVESCRTLGKSASLLFILFFVASIGLARAQFSDQVIDSVENLPTSKRIQFYYEALGQAEQQKDSVVLINSLASLARNHVFMEDFDKAEEYKKRLIDILLSNSGFDPHTLERVYRGLADVEGNLAQRYMLINAKIQPHPKFKEQRDKALWWHKKALKVSLDNDLNEAIPRNYYSVGQSMAFLIPYQEVYKDSSEYYLNQAIYWGSKLDQFEHVAGAYNWMGGVYYPSDQERALAHLDSASQIIDTLRGNSMWLEFNNNNFAFNAFALQAGLDTLIHLKNSIVNLRIKATVEDYEKEVAEAENKYQVNFHQSKSERSQQALTLEQARVNQRNLIIAAIALLLLGTGVGSLILFRLNRKNQKLAENNAMLVKEQNHRVKNNLQMISSLLSLQADRADDSSKETMLISSRRVQAIALLHRRLYNDLDGVKEVEIKTYIEELIQDILFATGKQDVPLLLNLENVSLPVEKAIHLALILNELVTNSLKHVFSRTRLNGECIELSLAKPNGQIKLTYRDNGGSFDVEAFKTSDSLGNQIIISQAAHLAQEFEVADEGGMKFEMKFAT